MRLHTLVVLSLLVAPALAAPPPQRLVLNEPTTKMDENSWGCLTCHQYPETSSRFDEHGIPHDERTMHPSGTVVVGCANCHGGHPDVQRPPDADEESDEYQKATIAAHGVVPKNPELWKSSANPERSYTALNKESEDFIRLINPGDLRVARKSCGGDGCHPSEVYRVENSMMTHGAMLWGAALYNNGGFSLKKAHFGESYSVDGTPQRLQTIPPPTPEEIQRGVLAFLNPLPRFEFTQPGNILRVFERGDDRLSPRGLGTINRTDPVFQGLQRTRLLDPLLSFLGTNDHPGDYRSSGCTACHVVYANDRDPFHSGPYAKFGNLGTTDTVDPLINRHAGQRGHPIRHVFTRGIPSSQCVVCHVHPGTSFANAYLGYTWWDNETHGDFLFPKQQQYPTPEQELESLSANPEATAMRGLWSNLYPKQKSHVGVEAEGDFLERTWELNPQLTLTKLADFHGHGWLFRAIFKHDRKGNLLDPFNDIVPEVTPANTQLALTTTVKERIDDDTAAGNPVHLKDIHLEGGMHCIDCHFEQDVHGDGKLYGEVRNAVEIECVDCHGSVRGPSTLRTSGPAAPPGGTDLSLKVTPFGRPVFEWRGDELFQRSMVKRDEAWPVIQVADTINPRKKHFRPKAMLAKTLRRDGSCSSLPESAPDIRAGKQDAPIWGQGVTRIPDGDRSALAHSDDSMACYTCHTSWMTSCFGCHLPMKANARRPALHYEGDFTRNWTSYNYQVLRDDVFMLGRDGNTKQNRIAPVRSSSAVLVGSQNVNREWLYSQQQTVSTEGFAGQAFNPHYPHAVRGRNDTKDCVDCHPSENGDNNAWMAQVMLQGTNFVNFLGRYIWVAEEGAGLEAVIVTEADEPQAVIGSRLHALAYPDRYKEHIDRKSVLPGSLMYEHPGNDVLMPFSTKTVQSLQLRGEYLYSANGEGGVYVYDVADIDNKKISERITTSIISPLGQRLYVRTPDAAAVVSPSTLAVDPTRTTRNPLNAEAKIHDLYAYLYILDRKKGLIITNAGTLLDGDPTNNFIDEPTRFVDGQEHWDAGGRLLGASNGTIAGHYLYVCTPRGVVIVDIENPRDPHVAATLHDIPDPRTVVVQFRYAFVAGGDALRVIDVLDPRNPVEVAALTIEGAVDVYVARTYAYVAAGRNGLVIVDVENPRAPTVATTYTADGAINDTRAVKVGMTNASLFAYLADGKNGLRVIQLMSPETPGYTGFSPKPDPDRPGHGLIATYPTHGPAVALSKGLDRDRAVDESGNQLAVFGRIGARPFNAEEQRRLYMKADGGGGAAYVVPDLRRGDDGRARCDGRPITRTETGTARHASAR